MAPWADVIRAHAKGAVTLYGERMREVERLAGIEIMPDGSNTATSRDQFNRYLQAVRERFGEIGYLSALFLTDGAKRKLGLGSGNNTDP